VGKTFDIGIKSESVGLYNIALNTVQKEHILLFDNNTVFSDIIYEPFTGFRQQRLKLVGWKTANWNGDYYAPGFVFDAAQVTYWTANTDYRIGDSVLNTKASSMWPRSTTTQQTQYSTTPIGR
jgi:hypothetical protein